jgi:hypothetical protein
MIERSLSARIRASPPRQKKFLAPDEYDRGCQEPPIISDEWRAASDKKNHAVFFLITRHPPLVTLEGGL